jgi:hypothetical protein
MLRAGGRDRDAHRGRDNEPRVAFREPVHVSQEESEQTSIQIIEDSSGSIIPSSFQDGSVIVIETPPDRLVASTSTAVPVASSSRKRTSAHFDIYPRVNDRVFVAFGRWWWYPAIVLEYSEDTNRSKVKFDDGSTKKDVEHSRMRKGELRVGDKACVMGNGGGDGVIFDVDHWNTRSKCQVRLDSGIEVQVDGTQIRIRYKAIEQDWDDRLVKPRDPPLPLPEIREASSTAFANQTRLKRPKKRTAGKGVFAGKAFVITLHPDGENPSHRKGIFKSHLESGGGVVHQDWDQLFDVGMKRIRQGTKRWFEAGKDTVKWIGGDHITEVLLIGDSASQTAKYLMALALGVPCVCDKWISDAMSTPESPPDWRHYLLSAGKSIQYGTNVSQFLDPSWGRDSDIHRNVMSSEVVRRPLLDKEILFIYPSATGRTRQKLGDQEAATLVPRMACAAGAARIEVTRSLDDVSTDLRNFDYVVVGTNDKALARSLRRSGANCTRVPWLKECLITGSLQPISAGSSEDNETSQETS